MLFILQQQFQKPSPQRKKQVVSILFLLTIL